MKHVTRQFQAWLEGTLESGDRLRIARHLESCEDCSTYFAAMSRLLEKPTAADLPRLEADPFLPTRIRAMAGKTRAGSGLPVVRRRALGWVGLSLMSAMCVLAVAIGVHIGKDLSAAASRNGDTEIISAYYDAFSPSELADDWAQLIATEDEGL
jgi:predicted anti-sigma-YlaC factor YlaD